MVGLSAFFAAAGGLPLGVVLTVTARGGLSPNAVVNRTLGAVVNAARSTPFIILMVALIPLSRLIAGTSIGTGAAVVPLSLAAIPFFARIVEAALREVDPGVVEAAKAMGASPVQIVTRVLLREAVPALILGMTITVVSLIGYSAMAGAVGGGGLGDLAIRYGYQRFRADVMLATVAVLIAQVQLLQAAGDTMARRLNRR